MCACAGIGVCTCASVIMCICSDDGESTCSGVTVNTCTGPGVCTLIAFIVRTGTASKHPSESCCNSPHKDTEAILIASSRLITSEVVHDNFFQTTDAKTSER